MEAAEFLANLTGVSVQLARMVILAEIEDETAGLVEADLLQIRISRVQFLVRIMRLFFENDEINLMLN